MTFEHTVAALAALDFSAEDARLAELEAERDAIGGAIDRANERRTEIDRALAAQRAERVTGSHSANVVADSLLAGASTTEAAALAPSSDALRDERVSLTSAIGELRRRGDDVRSAIESLHVQAAGKAASVAQPIADALRAQAKRAAEELLECYAGLRALRVAIGAGSREARQTQYAAAGCIGQDRLLSWRAQIPVPASVAHVIDALPPSKALRVGRAQTVPTPENDEHRAIIAALQAR